MTQSQRVLAFLRAHGGSSTMELQLGLHPFVANPRARISDLRARGYVIECRRRGDVEGFYVVEAAQLALSLA